MLKDNPIFSKFEKKNFEKKFFSARSWAATKKWLLERLGVKSLELNFGPKMFSIKFKYFIKKQKTYLKQENKA